MTSSLFQSLHQIIFACIHLIPLEWAWLAKIYWILFVFASEITVGALILHLIHSFTGGRWGEWLEPALRKLMRLTPFLLIALLPLLITMGCIFPWARPLNQTHLIEEFQNSPHAFADHFRLFCLTPLWFVLRAYLYSGIWAAISIWITKRNLSRLPRALMLLALLYSATLASMDWVMTIDPDWVSTGFGILFLIASLNAALSFALLLSIKTQNSYVSISKAQSKSENKLESSRALDIPLAMDIGNLLLMSALLWVYMNFMQYIVVWSAQDPHEMHWFQARSEGVWSFIIGALFAFHFLIPFPLLLSRHYKSKPKVLVSIAALFFASQFIEALLWVMP